MSLQLETEKKQLEQIESVLSLDANMPKIEELKVAQTQHVSLSGVVSLKEDQIKSVQSKADEFIAKIKAVNQNSSEASKLTNDIYSMANNEIQASGNLTNKVLDRPMKELKNGVVSSSSQVYTSLTDLRSTVESLDPTKMNSFFTKIKVFNVNVPVPSFLPGVNRLKSYAEQYESSQSVIDSICLSLDNSKDLLFRDIANFEVDKESLVKSIENLEYYLVMAKEIDAKLDAEVIQLKAIDPEKAKYLEQEMLFPARQKVLDISQRITLNMQALLIFNGLVKTNRELVRGIDRSKFITLSALKTAVMTALALNNQKQALNQIESLEKTTNNMLLKGSEMFKEQSADIYKRSANAAVDIETLKKSFQNVYTTLDNIAEFKSNALGNMKQLIETLEEETTKAKPYLKKALKETKV